MSESTRSNLFRYVYTNGFSLQVANGEVIIRFGLAEDPDEPEILHEEVGVVMNVQNLKGLSVTLSKVVESMEKTVGEFIEVPENYSLDIDEAIKRAESKKSKE